MFKGDSFFIDKTSCLFNWVASQFLFTTERVASQFVLMAGRVASFCGICGKAMIGICPFDVSFLTIRLIYCNWSRLSIFFQDGPRTFGSWPFFLYKKVVVVMSSLRYAVPVFSRSFSKKSVNSNFIFSELYIGRMKKFVIGIVLSPFFVVIFLLSMFSWCLGHGLLALCLSSLGFLLSVLVGLLFIFFVVVRWVRIWWLVVA